MLALIYRNAEDPTRANAEVIVTPAESPPAPLPNPAAEGSRVLVGAVDMRVSGNSAPSRCRCRVIRGHRPRLDRRRDGTGAVIRAYDQVFAAGGRIPTDDVFDQGVITRAGLFSIELGPMRAVVWEYEGDDIVLAAGEQRSFRAPRRRLLLRRDRALDRQRRHHGLGRRGHGHDRHRRRQHHHDHADRRRGGRDHHRLRLRAFSISQAVDNPQTREDAGSIAAYGERGYDQRLWPYLSQSEAGALAQEIVDYSSHPRRAWTVKLDADRNADTAAAARAELGQTVRTASTPTSTTPARWSASSTRSRARPGCWRRASRCSPWPPPLPHRLFLGSTPPALPGLDRQPDLPPGPRAGTRSAPPAN